MILPRRLIQRYRPDPTRIPAAPVEVAARSLRLGDGACASFAVSGYPAEVGPAWLEPLLAYPGRLDVSVHIEPVPAPVAADRLRRDIARNESSARADDAAGRVPDHAAEAAVEDANDLATAVARGQSRLFRVGLYLTVHVTDPADLDAAVSEVRAIAGGLLLDAQPATFRQLNGWTTAGLPLAHDSLRVRRTLDTPPLAAAFPFVSPDLATPLTGSAVLYGANTSSTSLVIWDRFAQENYNAVVLARSGAGKSYLTKLELLRSLYRGVEALVIDPENEYTRLAEAVGGTVIALGAPGTYVNPLDLDPTAPDALTRQALFLHTLVAVMLDTRLDPATAAALDRAAIAAYTRAGITSDPRTWSRPAPLLGDLAAALRDDGDPHAADLANRLDPYITGSRSGMFSHPTSHSTRGHLVVYNLRDLPEEMKPVGTLIAADAIWRTITDTGRRRKRLVVIDEGWLLLRTEAGARFCNRMAKAARKHWAGLTIVTQDAADVLASDLGRAVVNNAATHILLRQSAQAIDQVASTFGLTDGERQHLLSAPLGTGLLSTGTTRVGFQALASPTEHWLITTDPAELADVSRPGTDGTEQ